MVRSPCLPIQPNKFPYHLRFLLADNFFHFTCFNVDDPHDPSVGLINGQLSIPGNLLRREVFDPVINEVGLISCNLNLSEFSILY